MAEYTYDHVIVGAGISGLTTALLLARQGRRVLIIEKAPAIGGSMVRFPVNGIPFETGFHFTGGLEPKGLLYDMLKVLEIDEQIKPRAFGETDGMRFLFESSGNRYTFSCRREGLIQELVARFPEEEKPIGVYFDRIDEICSKTASMNLRTLSTIASPLDEDYESLTSVLDQLFQSLELKVLLAGYCLCYGVGPDEISFANHARICQGMYDGLVTVEGGGDAFVSALKAKLEHHGVDIRCRCTVEACEEFQGRNVGAFRLSDGDLVRFTSAVLTIHPLDILKLLPPEKVRPAFRSRIEGFEASCGFFAVFGTCDAPELLNNFILLALPEPDLNKVFAPGDPEADSMLFGICGEENGTRTLTILEAARPEEYAQWADSSLQRRPEAYNEFKQRKTRRIVERMLKLVPELEGHFQPLESSSPLTFRDYLNSPDGSAYGIKQLMGQFNLLGKLPVRNLYAAGQSSVLPGVMGAMASAFIIGRGISDTEEFDRNIEERLDA